MQPASYQQLRLSTTSLSRHIHVNRYISGSNLIAQVCLPLESPLVGCQFGQKVRKTLNFLKKWKKQPKNETQRKICWYSFYAKHRTCFTVLSKHFREPASHVDCSRKSTGRIISRRLCTGNAVQKYSTINFNTVYYVRVSSTNSTGVFFSKILVNGSGTKFCIVLEVNVEKQF